MKRPSDSDEGDLPVKRVHTSPNVDLSQFVRDADYYLQDGDLVFLVNKTLFRVHRFILCRDSSTFQNMLGVCTGTEGSSDNNPLQLHSDTVEAVRSLLSMFYALPDELQTKFEAFGQETGLDSLLTLAEIVNKYHFSSTERRLVKIFEDHVLNHGPHLEKNIMVDNLKRALRVAIMQNARNIQTRLLDIFVRRVFDRSIPVHVALEFANTYSLRPLQGAAHYVCLKEAIPVNAGRAAFEVAKFGQGIDEDLKTRLLHGYWSLMHTCLRLRSTPPIDLAVCEVLGIAAWHRSYDFFFDGSSPGLLELLQRIKVSLCKWCGQHLDQALVNKVLFHFDLECLRVKDNLMDHFEPCR